MEFLPWRTYPWISGNQNFKSSYCEISFFLTFTPSFQWHLMTCVDRNKVDTSKFQIGEVKDKKYVSDIPDIKLPSTSNEWDDVRNFFVLYCILLKLKCVLYSAGKWTFLLGCERGYIGRKRYFPHSHGNNKIPKERILSGYVEYTIHGCSTSGCRIYILFFLQLMTSSSNQLLTNRIWCW